ncbi:uncharacterized protein LOC109857142 [Pseudomyrmex gracilis]|uniref:uncharacterized protein LOC109857142 n=1 Tax=Pseudomyrmex gracilis TaxID=219809 RepID=UPI0009956E80|nr:uncharacterized protein LOC109857142 [Pseudomyrmex gracilis]
MRNVQTTTMLVVYGSLSYALIALQNLFKDSIRKRRLYDKMLRALEMNIVYFLYYKLICNMSRLIEECQRNAAKRTEQRALRNPAFRRRLKVIKCIDLLEFYLGEEETGEIMRKFKQCILAKRINLKSKLLWNMIHRLRRLPKTNRQVEAALLDAFWHIRTPAEARTILSEVPYFVDFKRNVIDEMD